MESDYTLAKIWHKSDLFYNVFVVRNETFETFDIVFLIS